MLNYLAERYKTFIKSIYFNKAAGLKRQYAFIGTGSHARSQLYPVLQYLNVPLKYIYSRNEKNSKSMSAIYKNSTGVSEMSRLINDDDIRGIFVSVSAKEHFNIAKRLLEAGKHIFIEKPPCTTAAELDTLLSFTTKNIFHVNLQQRYAPAIKMLYKKKKEAKFYSIKYLTGGFNEGDLLTELFIHALDIALHLFDEVEDFHASKIATATGVTYLIQTRHISGVRGNLKLSTAYSWQQSCEKIEMHCSNEFYTCNFPSHLKKTLLPKTYLGIPAEKLFTVPIHEEILLNGHNISTAFSSHTNYLYGFYNSIETFVSAVEQDDTITDHTQLRNLYSWIEQLKRL